MAKCKLLSLEAAQVHMRQMHTTIARNMLESELLMVVRDKIYSGELTDPYIIQLVNKIAKRH